MVGEPARIAGVLGEDEIDAGERLQRPQRDIGEISDGRRYDMQPRRGRWR
jgi:hypothetical protein